MDETVEVLAPTGRDAPLARDVLALSSIDSRVAADLDILLERIKEDPGAVIVAEEALEKGGLDRLVAALAQQPPWSDLPVIVLTGADRSVPTAPEFSRLGNVSYLDRPVRVRVLVSAVEAALRARRRQYQVRRLLEQAEANVRARDQFLAMLGHELRNPLGSILFATELLGLAPTEDLESKQRATIHRQTKLLARLVDDLLDVSRVTSGKIVLQKQPVELSEIGARCAQNLDSMRQQNGLVLRFEKADPVWVQGDPVRLEQVVTNLLVNAFKYTPSGGTVTLQVSGRDRLARILVRDTGIGIEPRMLPRIFDLFAQAEAGLERSRGGLGIGLTLVRSLVELHGGEVAVRSAGPGKGSEFEVVLPEVDAPAQQVPDEAPRQHRPAERALRVLVVDDNADIRESLVQLLATDGHLVTSAANGIDAVRSAVEFLPDVAVVDIGLPGMDGYEVARRLRSALGGGVLLVALTGYGQPEDRRRAVQAGFDHHLVKPVPLTAVEAVLESFQPPRAARG